MHGIMTGPVMFGPKVNSLPTLPPNEAGNQEACLYSLVEQNEGLIREVSQFAQEIKRSLAGPGGPEVAMQNECGPRDKIPSLVCLLNCNRSLNALVHELAEIRNLVG